jgi:hypothetical protein
MAGVLTEVKGHSFSSLAVLNRIFVVKRRCPANIFHENTGARDDFI